MSEPSFKIVATEPCSTEPEEDVNVTPDTLDVDPETPLELIPWLDTFALAIAAGVRVGERGLLRATPANGNDRTAPPIPDEGDDVLTTEEVAELLKLGRNLVYEAVGRGEIPHRRIGKQIRFSRRGIMRWLASCEAAEDKEHR